MKKLLVTILCLAIADITINAQNKQRKDPKSADQRTTQAKIGKFKFVEEIHDFGEVPEGPLVECDFVFTNVGNAPILISDAHASCGCTVPQWPKEPIMPRKTGTIHVTYNTYGHPGAIENGVTLTSNAEQSQMVLRIKGTVKAKPAEEQSEEK